MGAKQSKRSVDISGKEAEGGGEVAAAGAGGEGRVEQLADADALKPQLNGAAHIQHEQTDKEKELDSGTPENEKDATTEKEGKEEDEKEKEVAPVTNGETEPKVENGESTPTPEDGKKPKKEKVKKKWSLRSISFSRKDKPKQEKKQKEEEPKTNGEPEKVPEETAEAVPEATENEIAEEVKATAEEKEEKTPETPVTEPLTNGTSTPESTKAETPASEEASPVPVPAAAPAPAAEPSPPAATAPEPAPEPQPEPDQLPVNGLSLEEPKLESPELEKPEATKPEPPVAETVEIVPAPEIPKEVCVEQLPLLEPTPPPLPANPPPSSVASFAATTMAPELTDASLANTADAAIAPFSALPETKDILAQPEPLTETAVTDIPEIEIPFVLKENIEDASAVTVCDPEIQTNAFEATVVTEIVTKPVEDLPEPDSEIVLKEPSEIKTETAETPLTLTQTLVTKTSETMTKETSEIVVKETVVTVVENIVKATSETVIDNVATATSETIIDNVATATSDAIIDNVATRTSETIIDTLATATSETINESLVETPENDVPDKPETVVLPQIEIPDQTKPLETELTKADPTDVEIVRIETSEIVPVCSEINVIKTENVQKEAETVQELIEPVAIDCLPEPENIPESEVDISEADDSSLPPPPMQEEDDAAPVLDDDKVEESLKQIPEPIATETNESNHISNNKTTNGLHDVSPDADDMEVLKIKAKAAVASADPGCNGAGEEAPAEPPRLPNGATASPHHTPQEPLPVSDKLADLIPEVPDVPELKPETLQETVTDVAVAN